MVRTFGFHPKDRRSIRRMGPIILWAPDGIRQDYNEDMDRHVVCSTIFMHR